MEKGCCKSGTVITSYSIHYTKLYDYAFIASVAVMKHLSPYTVMLTINLEPIYGIILAVIVFQEKEKMNPSFYVGALIILSTVILNAVVKNYQKKQKLKNNLN